MFRAASRRTPDEELQRLLAPDFDWALLFTLAEREYATAVLWQRMRRLERDMPVVVQTQLRNLSRVMQFRMDYAEQRLAASVAALEAENIECVLLKGAALGSTTYGSFAERPMSDLDILVHPRDARPAQQALLNAGWVASGETQSQGYGGQPHHHLLPLLDARGVPLSLEVHQSLLPTGHPFAFEADLVWSRSRRGVRGSTWARVPDPLHSLLHTCIHFAWSHLLRKGAWRGFRDVEALTTHYAIDWQAFTSLASAAGAKTCCYWTLQLAQSVAGVPVPNDVVAAFRPPLPRAALSLLERHFALILVPTGYDCPSVTLRRLMWAAGMLPRWNGHGSRRRWDLPSATPPIPALQQEGGASTPLTAGWAHYARSVLFGVRPLSTTKGLRRGV